MKRAMNGVDWHARESAGNLFDQVRIALACWGRIHEFNGFLDHLLSASHFVSSPTRIILPVSFVKIRY
jgi:hypothetical protein